MRQCGKNTQNESGGKGGGTTGDGHRVTSRQDAPAVEVDRSSSSRAFGVCYLLAPTSMLLFRIFLFLATLALLVPDAAAQIRALARADTTTGDHFGAAVVLDSDRALVGATGEGTCGLNAGAAYVFERDTSGVFVEAARLVPDDCASGDLFGRAVALSSDRALVAAGGQVIDPNRPNAAYVFERDSTGAWRQTAKLTAEPNQAEGSFAASLALDGDRALITTSGDPAQRSHGGAAYVFERDSTGGWQRVARLEGSGGTDAGIFGSHAALDGDRALVTASPYNDDGTGSVYVFERDDTGDWNETARIGGVESFRVHAALDGDRLLIGHGRGGPNRSGEAVFYHRSQSGDWRRIATLVPSVPYRDGGFGAAVSLDGDRALVVGYSEQIGLEFNIDRVVYAFAYTPEAGWAQQQVVDVGAWAFGTAVDQAGRLALIGQASEAEPGAAYLVELF